MKMKSRKDFSTYGEYMAYKEGLKDGHDEAKEMASNKDEQEGKDIRPNKKDDDVFWFN